MRLFIKSRLLCASVRVYPCKAGKDTLSLMNVQFIAELREQRELTQLELAERVGVSRQTLFTWEKGERMPSMVQLTKLAQALEVSVDLFLKQESQLPTLLFRADDASSLSPALRAVISQKVGDYAELERDLGEIATLPPAYPLEEYDPVKVERLSREVRDFLGVEEAPLGDVISVLEDRGLKVLLTALPKSVSGFSAYTDEWGAVIVVNATHRVERQYFTVLHELAHLVCHRKDYAGLNVPVVRDPREKIANHLAGATLLARDVVEYELRAYKGKWIPEPILIALKHRYSVSMRTILMRAEQVGLITTKQKGQQLGMLNKAYTSESEPTSLQRHFECAGEPLMLTSRLERLVYQAASEQYITRSRAAEILGVPLHIVRAKLSEWVKNQHSQESAA